MPYRTLTDVRIDDRIISLDDVDITGDAKKWGIITGLRGSLSHGTYRPPEEGGIDDIDAISIIVPGLEYYFGNRKYHKRGTFDKSTDPYDMVYHEFLKFVSLLCKQNPNVLSLLWLPHNQYFQLTETGYMFLEHREVFLTKHVYTTHVGYAHQQLERMEKNTFEGYMGKRRKELVEEHGWDCKKGAHTIRLLRMGRTALLEGRMEVVRPDHEELIAIKEGEWSLEQVKDEADRLFQACNEARDKSPLPDEVDWEKVHEITQSILVRLFAVDRRDIPHWLKMPVARQVPKWKYRHKETEINVG